jgi:hypothetical protein
MGQVTMERQLDLFSPPTPAFANAPITRAAAGVAIRPDAARLRAKVLRYIKSRGADGATDAEIQGALDMSGDTERPRRRELQAAGFIADSGRTRLTPAGRAAVVWTATIIHRQTNREANQ